MNLNQGSSLFLNTSALTIKIPAPEAAIGNVLSNGNFLIGTTTDNTGRLQIVAPGAASTDFGLRVRNSGNTADLLSVAGNGVLSVGGSGSDAVINLARGSYGAIVGAIIQTTSFTQIHNYQGNGTDFFVAGATNVQRAFVRSTGFGVSGTNGGNFTLDASAALQVNSVIQGFLPPRMTNAQRLAIATPAIGLVVYCTDVVEGLYINKSTGWTFVI
jgi:FAD/FMN-containing dehydrogenase